MKISVIGCGYLGAHAACMAELGHEIIGVDTDSAKIACSSSGRAPFHENGLDELLAKHTANGRLRFSTRFDDAADFADVHFVTVGTPQRFLRPVVPVPGGRATRAAAASPVVDHRQVHCARRYRTATGRMDPQHRGGGRLGAVGVESRVPAGVFGDLRHAAARPHRGGLDRTAATAEETEKTVRSLYAPVVDAGAALVVTDLTTAELTKTAANAFLSTKISFIRRGPSLRPCLPSLSASVAAWEWPAPTRLRDSVSTRRPVPRSRERLWRSRRQVRGLHRASRDAWCPPMSPS
jgi:UDPglucose 6-dehydrogenase